MDHAPISSGYSESLRPATPAQPVSKQMTKSKSQSRIMPPKKIMQPLSSPKGLGQMGLGDFDEAF